MPDTYKQYNNYSQQDKDSMRTEADIASNTNEQTLISQTDQVESLLGDIKTLLGDVKTALGQIKTSVDNTKTSVDAVKTSVDNTKTAVDDVKAAVNTNGTNIQNKQDAAKGVLDTIALNTTPTE